MMNTTVLYVLADGIRDNFKRTQFGRREWIEGTVGLAENFWKARQQFAVNQEFSIWLGNNNLDYFGKNDRAALISIGGNIKLTKCVLEETMSVSYRRIWGNERKIRLSTAYGATRTPFAI